MFRHTTLLLTALGTMAGAAHAAPTVTAYGDDGMVTVNGKRTFILGSYHIGSKYATERPRTEALAEMAEAGFNLVHTGVDQAQLDEAQAAGLMVWVTVGTLDLEKRDESAAALVEKVNGVKDHPALAILESVDEPAWDYGKVGPRIPAEPFVEAYPIIKQADPNHLMYMNHAPTNLVKTMRAYNGGTDIVAMDIYPVNPGDLKPMYALF
ncbi:MAG: hypothetical protein GY851_14550, partial [bacterium]|nr:hypothetical protein [bacterium]